MIVIDYNQSSFCLKSVLWAHLISAVYYQRLFFFVLCSNPAIALNCHINEVIEQKVYLNNKHFFVVAIG